MGSSSLAQNQACLHRHAPPSCLFMTSGSSHWSPLISYVRLQCRERPTCQSAFKISSNSLRWLVWSDYFNPPLLRFKSPRQWTTLKTDGSPKHAHYGLAKRWVFKWKNCYIIKNPSSRTWWFLKGECNVAQCSVALTPCVFCSAHYWSYRSQLMQRAPWFSHFSRRYPLKTACWLMGVLLCGWLQLAC